jgi:uncharacterized Ntn-hydrolase superfamily protein
VAVSTAVPCTGVVVPHVRAGVGAIATQADANIRLGIDGLRLLELGLSPEAALTSLLAEDADAAHRQAAAIDSRGRVFAYSGDRCVDWYGHRIGEDYSVQGNMLVGQATIDAMAGAFEASSGELAERLLAALEAGQAAGGDKRGRESAAIKVRAANAADWGSGVDLRVDLHADPVAELARLFAAFRERQAQLLEEAKREQASGP